jgi:hypothetical protein
MIDIFIRHPATEEYMHPRVQVMQVRNFEHAVGMLSVFAPSDTDVPIAAGRPARRFGTIQQLIKLRDAALDRLIAKKPKSEVIQLRSKLITHKRG